MSQPGYKQFCPVAMAAEVLCTRWTMVLMRELIAGSTRFNDGLRWTSCPCPPAMLRSPIAASRWIVSYVALSSTSRGPAAASP